MSDPSLTVAPEPFDSADSRPLIAALDTELDALYPPEQRFGPNFKAEQIERGRGTFLVARHGGRAVACGAIRLLDETTAEVKRMYSEPPLRGTGVGRAVLESLEAAARDPLSRRHVGAHLESVGLGSHRGWPEASEPVPASRGCGDGDHHGVEKLGRTAWG